MNFLNETAKAIAESGHSPEDIVFIGSTESGHSCTWEEFTSLADFNYDSGYGAAYMASDLVVVFSDGADLHRAEYDGSEWWDFSRPFVAPEKTPPIKTFQGGLWPTLAQQQDEESE